MVIAEFATRDAAAWFKGPLNSLCTVMLFIAWFKEKNVELCRKFAFSNSDDHDCGGSVIDNRWILTSRRCVQNTLGEGSSRVIYAGVNRVDGNENTLQKSEIENIFLHPVNILNSTFAILSLNYR